MLVAEDDPVNRLVVRDLLAGKGAVVTLATTGAEAVSLAARGHLDIALMDIQMPEMDGLAACRRIRTLKTGGDLPIIALSARTLGDEREQCIAAGMNGYLAKPLEPQRLFDELCRWFAAPATGRAEPAPGEGMVQPSAPAPDVPILPGFDETVVRRWYARHPNGYARAIRTFLAEYGESVSSIEEALDAGRYEQAADRLHRLRGAAGVLGAKHLAEPARRLEDVLRQQGQADAQLRGRFLAEGESLVTTLSSFVVSSGTEDPTSDAVTLAAARTGCLARILAPDTAPLR